MFLILKNTISRFTLSDTPVLLRRLNINYCKSILHKKVTFLNEDHSRICKTISESKLLEEENERIYYSIITELYI